MPVVADAIKKGDWNLASKCLSVDLADFCLLGKVKDVSALNATGNLILQ